MRLTLQVPTRSALSPSREDFPFFQQAIAKEQWLAIPENAASLIAQLNDEELYSFFLAVVKSEDSDADPIFSALLNDTDRLRGIPVDRLGKILEVRRDLPSRRGRKNSEPPPWLPSLARAVAILFSDLANLLDQHCLMEFQNTWVLDAKALHYLQKAVDYIDKNGHFKVVSEDEQEKLDLEGVKNQIDCLIRQKKDARDVRIRRSAPPPSDESWCAIQ